MKRPQPTSRSNINCPKKECCVRVFFVFFSAQVNKDFPSPGYMLSEELVWLREELLCASAKHEVFKLKIRAFLSAWRQPHRSHSGGAAPWARRGQLGAVAILMISLTCENQSLQRQSAVSL